jgi:hypothetical protein
MPLTIMEPGWLRIASAITLVCGAAARADP